MSKTLSNIITFSIALFLSKIIGTVTTFCTARILHPAEYGIWVTLGLIVSYSTILCLGTVETLVKQVPYYIGKKDDAMIRRIDGGVLASIFFSSGILVLSSLIIFIINFIFKPIPFHQYIQITLITAALAIFSCFYYYRLTAFSRFNEVSMLNSSRAFITFILVVGFGWRWHLLGMVSAALFTETIMLILSMIKNQIINRPFSLIFDRKLFWGLIKIGFPITLVWWGYVVMTSIDRVISMALLGKTFTGFYSLGTSIVSILILVPMAIGQVLYPQVNEAVGKSTPNVALSKFVVFPTQVMSLVIPVFLGPLFFLTPIIYKYLFPKYLPGYHSAQILLCGAFFVCLVKSGVNYLVAIDKQSVVFKYVVLSLVSNVIITFIAIKMNYNIEGIAFGAAIGSLLLTTMIWMSVFKNLNYSFGIQIQKLIQLYTPLTIMTIFLFVIHGIMKLIIIDSFIRISLSLLIFLIIYSLIIYSIPFLRDWALLMINKCAIPKR